MGNIEKIWHTLLGIVLIGIGVFFVFIAIKAVAGRGDVSDVLDAAPFITDGKVDPANEGKTVILLIKNEDMREFTGAYDDEFGFHFSYPFVTRYAERLNMTADNSIVWQPVGEEGEFPNQKYFSGDMQWVDYEIDADLFRSIGGTATKNLYEEDFDADEVEALLQDYQALQFVEWDDDGRDILYLTDTEEKNFRDFETDEEDPEFNLTYYRMEDAVGSSRLHYTGINLDEVESVALIGRQEGNRLVKDESLDTLTAHENVTAKEDLIKKEKTEFGLGVLLFGFLGGGLCIFFGVRNILKRKEL